jgi:uncharacterized repeat protein (TIGR03837 family)
MSVTDAMAVVSARAGPGRAWHLYCAIVDNFGDIGVCWRLARQLALERGQTVTLWVDLWEPARMLIPGLPAIPARTVVDGIAVRPWSEAGAGDDLTGDVLIEGFGCALPGPTLAQLAAREIKPVWINLEYFSAESWVPGFHLGSGFDAATRATRWFFFPGIDLDSGGLLREGNLIAARDAWQESGQGKALLARLGAPASRGELKVLCFAYAGAPYRDWLDALERERPAPVSIWLCGQASQAAVKTVVRAKHPNLQHADLPFVSQPDFDRLLWTTDLAIVRGEDSLARALWSGRPFLWHIYPQAEAAHHPKLEAWLSAYTGGFPPALRSDYVAAHRAWNGITPPETLGPAWAGLMRLWPEWQAHSRLRSAAFANSADLVSRLIHFVEAAAIRVK